MNATQKTSVDESESRLERQIHGPTLLVFCRLPPNALARMEVDPKVGIRPRLSPKGARVRGRCSAVPEPRGLIDGGRRSDHPYLLTPQMLDRTSRQKQTVMTSALGPAPIP
jgi:hypothetical protein